jgi:hypothetical protein
MSHDGSVELYWGEGLTRFRLKIDQLLALESKFDCGVIEILDRFPARRWRLGEVKEIIRNGLIGAEIGLQKANSLVDTYFDKMGLAPLEHVPFAHAILAVSLSGIEGQEQGEATAATSETEASASTPPPSTDQEPAWAGRPPKSKRARSPSSPPPSKAGTKAKKAKKR